MLTPDEIKRLAANDFSRDCKEIVLTQCGSSSPLVWRGPGTLSISSSGKLQVKLFIAAEADYFNALCRKFASDEPAGTLMSDTQYYDMVAYDCWGTEWHAKRFLIDEQLYIHTESGTISATPKKITCRSNLPNVLDKYRQVIVLRGSPKIPFTRMVQQPNGSFTRSAIDFALTDGTAIEITQKDGLCIIAVEHPSQAVRPVARKILEAISIASGCRVESMYQMYTTRNEAETTIWSAQLPPEQKENALWSPLQPHMPESFSAFISEYVTFVNQTSSGFFDYWLKVYEAWQLGAFLSALPLSVYIEGIVTDYFSDHKLEPLEFTSDVDKVIAIVKDAAVPDVVIKRCVGALSKIKEKSTTQALKSLAKQGWFSQSLIKTWGDIRHKSAHGHDITTSDTDQQALLDSTLKCLHLFYLLLLIRMRFTQDFRDLSTHGFPKIRLPCADSRESP